MKFNKLKKVCDEAIGLESEIVDIKTVIEEGTENEETIVGKALRYTSPTGAYLFNVPIAENNPVGWHLEGKLNVREEDIYPVFQRAYRSARMEEVSEIQKNRGQHHKDAIEQNLVERIKKLEGALHIARTWMGREIEGVSEVDSESFERDTTFVEQVLSDVDSVITRERDPA